MACYRRHLPTRKMPSLMMSPPFGGRINIRCRGKSMAAYQAIPSQKRPRSPAACLLPGTANSTPLRRSSIAAAVFCYTLTRQYFLTTIRCARKRGRSVLRRKTAATPTLPAPSATDRKLWRSFTPLFLRRRPTRKSRMGSRRLRVLFSGIFIRHRGCHEPFFATLKASWARAYPLTSGFILPLGVCSVATMALTWKTHRVFLMINPGRLINPVPGHPWRAHCMARGIICTSRRV